MNKKILFLFLAVFTNLALTAQQTYNFNKKFLIIDIEKSVEKNVGYTFCKTKDSKGMEIYVLNSRYKLKNKRSLIGETADFLFTFYIIPIKKKLKLEEIKNPEKIISNQILSVDSVSKYLSSTSYSSAFDFKPIIKLNNKYYSYNDCYITGQALNLIEDSQYFPKFGAGSNKFEINFLAKPYSKNAIDSLRKIISKDMTAIKPFASWVDDFYEKWYIDNIDYKTNTITFWIDLKTIASEGFYYGRTNTEIAFKVNFGINSFKMLPVFKAFDEFYFQEGAKPVQFNFDQIEDLKPLINH